MRVLRRVMFVLGVTAARPGSGAPRTGVASRALASVGSLMCVTTVCLVAQSASASAASPVTVTLSPSVQEQDFTVPAGVTSLHILVRGGSGGAGYKGGSTGGAGGGGTQVTGTLGVSPGQQLSAFVAFAGSPGTAPGGTCFLGDTSAFSQGGGYGAGYIDGGGGGTGSLCLGGGGGAGGGLTVFFDDSGDIIDAGGGGGGGGGGGIAGYGGGAGGSSGFIGDYFPGQDGSGPGHGSGGAAAAGDVGDGTSAAPGSSAGGGGGGGAGVGNDGTASGTVDAGSGGTGGGGGAGGGGGGGAGHSFVANSVSDVSISAGATSTGSTGVNGTVVITYTPPTSTLTPPVAPKLHLAIAGPRGVKPGHTATYRITLHRTERHHRRTYPVKNVRVVSTHAGHRLAHWRVRTLPRGRSRTLHLKLHVPTTAHGSYCITTRATARHTHAAAVRHCIAVKTAPPQGLG